MFYEIKIYVPKFIESIILFFLLLYRKKKYGFAFRRIKLFGSRHFDSKHRYALVDADDYERLSEYDWQVFQNPSKNFYAFRTDGIKIFNMHRVIMNAPKGKIVDHKDGNGLNNTKANLRFAAKWQNNCNIKRKTSKTGRRGVSKEKDVKRWRAQISYEKNKIHLGCFDTLEQAARAYDEAAKKYHGEFAVLNFPDSQQNTKEQANKGFIDFIKAETVSFIKTFYGKLNQFMRRSLLQNRVFEPLDPAPLNIKISK